MNKLVERSLKKRLTPAEQAAHGAALQEKMQERRKAARKHMDERNKRARAQPAT